MRCPACGNEMESGFLYVRGIGGALFWSTRKDAQFLSRKGLEQVDLSAISLTGTGTQAVVEAARCAGCKTISFRSA